MLSPAEISLSVRAAPDVIAMPEESPHFRGLIAVQTSGYEGISGFVSRVTADERSPRSSDRDRPRFVEQMLRIDAGQGTRLT